MRENFQGSMSLISQSLKHESIYELTHRTNTTYTNKMRKIPNQENIYKFNNRFICHAQSFTFVLCIVGAEWIFSSSSSSLSLLLFLLP